MNTLLNEALKVADACDVYVREVESTSVSMSKGVLKQIQTEKKTEVALRLVKDGLIGSAVATDIQDDSLIQRALISLENQGSQAGEFPSVKFKAVKASSKDVADLSLEEMVEEVQTVNDRIKAKAEDVQTSIGLTRTLKKVHLINSAGFEGHYDYSNYSLGMSTITDQGFHGASKSYSSGAIAEVMDHHIDDLILHHRLSDKKIQLDNEVMPVIFCRKSNGVFDVTCIGRSQW
jgi:PmbA protein